MRIVHKNEGGSIAPPLNKYAPLMGLSVLCCIPTRDGKCSLHFAVSLAETVKLLNDNGVEVVIAKSDNSCFVDLSRNLFVQHLLSTKCTHLLQIDDDMAWSPKSILEMLLKDKEFIAGIGRKKTMAEEYSGTLLTEDGSPIGETGEKEEDVIIKMKRIGGAFTLIKRSVFEKLDTMFPQYRNEGLGNTFYRLEYDDKGLITEDYFFCQLCEKAGVDIWCYPNVTMGHLGSFDFKGNYFNYLKKCKEKENELSEKVIQIAC